MTDDVRAAERLRWLGQTMNRWLLALALLVVAMAVGITWTLGLFSSSSANPRNVVTAGSMSQVSSAEGAAIMGASDMIPGDSSAGTVTIENAGDARGDFRLTIVNVVDVPGPGGGKLSAALQLSVTDTGTGRSVYDGRFDALDVSLGTWTPEEKRSYRFVVALPKASEGTNNKYQKSKVTATFSWNAVQSH